ncbi:MAG TPA: hypothetical protein VHK67_07980 [Rhabdochlamydiaceae bacterium]|jgi:hypothetical protein|nr:hypothetical protein [Rhabdochlamydiaceae bacterium]
MVVPTISRFVGMMTAEAAGSAYYRYCHSKPALKRVATRIYPSAPALRFPYSNPIIQSLASRIYPIGRAFFNTGYRMIKSWLPKTPLLCIVSLILKPSEPIDDCLRQNTTPQSFHFSQCPLFLKNASTPFVGGVPA